jgi:hypothetical protein
MREGDRAGEAGIVLVAGVCFLAGAQNEVPLLHHLPHALAQRPDMGHTPKQRRAFLLLAPPLLPPVTHLPSQAGTHLYHLLLPRSAPFVLRPRQCGRSS